MGALARFLLILDKLVKGGTIKKIDQAIKFAKNEFGEVTPLIKKQIEKVFESAKKPLVGKTGKKEGTVLPLVKKIAEKKEEGIASLDDSSPLMDKLGKDVEEFRLSDDDPMGDLEQILNPKRPGGSLDPATGITRALARRILDRKGIEIGKKDPINVFTDTFGESISDVNNLAEEMLEIDARGGGMKDMDQMLEADGLFDIEIPTNPQKGLTDDELLELIKKTDEEKILTDFDPKDRKPSAEGGLMRTSYAYGSGLKLAILLARKGKNLKEEIKKAVDNIFSSGDSKYDADVALDNMLEDLNIDRDAVDQKDIMDAYGKAYNMLAKEKGLMSTKVPGGMKPGSKSIIPKDEYAEYRNDFDKEILGKDSSTQVEELKREFPGITDEMIENLLRDKNPQRIAEVKQTMREAMAMEQKGMSSDEIIKTFKDTTRRKQATGGRVRAASGGLAKILNL